MQHNAINPLRSYGIMIFSTHIYRCRNCAFLFRLMCSTIAFYYLRMHIFILLFILDKYAAHSYFTTVDGTHSNWLQMYKLFPVSTLLVWTDGFAALSQLATVECLFQCCTQLGTYFTLSILFLLSTYMQNHRNLPSVRTHFYDDDQI